MITPNKHSIGIITAKGKPLVMGLTEKFVEGAPEEWRGLAKSALDCCRFLEQFKLAGHFTFGVKDPLSCIGLSDISIDLKDVYAKGTEIPILDIAASLTLTIYAGLVYITDNPVQYAFEYKKMKYADATDEIGWKDHVVLSVDYEVKKGDVAYCIIVYEKTEKEALKQVGSYSAFEEKLMGEEGKELEAPEEVKERFRKLYGKGNTIGKIKGVTRDEKGD